MAEPPRTRRIDPDARSRLTGSGPSTAPASGSGPPRSDRSEWEGVRTSGERFGAPPRGRDERPSPDLGALIGLLGSVRAVVPPELDQQVTALLREVLLTVRALIDWYLERLDTSRPERRVEDIPIE